MTITSAEVEKMLSIMQSKVGDAYTEDIPQRFGPNQFDCSGLVWYAATQAGIPMPGGPSDDGAAIVGPELQWLAKQPGSQIITSPKDIQAGDIIGFTGGDPDPATVTIGGKGYTNELGHIGMATSGTQYVSAYDTAEGVRVNPISGDTFNVAVRPASGVTSSATQTAAGSTNPASSEASELSAGTFSAFGTSVASMLAPVSGLFHGIATILDYIFSMFGQGQSWRIAFTIGFIAILLLSAAFFMQANGVQLKAMVI